jgi:Protein of unknown function (DUF1236)
MWLSMRHGVLTISLIAGAALLAAAQSGGSRGVKSAGVSAMDETTGSLGGNRRATPELALSDEQRGRIYDSVMRIPDTPIAHAPAPTVADALPQDVPMQDLPAGVTRDIPLVEGHKFVKFDDRIVVVEPASRVVVAMIPRYKLLP